MLHDLRCLFTAAASLGVVVGGCSRKKEDEEEEVASMAFTLYSLIQTAILCTNAIAVLHEERFLSKSKFSTIFYSTYTVDVIEITTNNVLKQLARCATYTLLAACYTE